MTPNPQFVQLKKSLNFSGKNLSNSFITMRNNSIIRINRKNKIIKKKMGLKSESIETSNILGMDLSNKHKIQNKR